jgi:hypothetical protein
VRPVLQALILADRVYEDKSGKKIIAGTFNRVLLNRTAHIPKDHPTDETKKLVQGGTDIGCPSVYVSLTDVVPELDVTLQFTNVSTNQVLLEMPIKIQCPDRLATVEFAMALPPLGRIVQGPGTYSLDLVWNGEIIGSHRIVAQDVTEQGD